jgi:hypothetical protein
MNISTRGCGIYDHRPMECRVLNCRDTRRIESVYDTDRLTRQDLLSGIRGLWELIEDHEQRCSYDGLKSLVREGDRDGRPKKEEALLEVIRYDSHVRRLTTEQGGMDGSMLDFIFGRPLVDTIKMFDLALIREAGAYRLIFRQPVSKR